MIKLVLFDSCRRVCALDLAGAGGAGPWVAQQDTGMVTARCQVLPTDVPTCVRGQPGVSRGVLLLATEASVL